MGPSAGSTKFGRNKKTFLNVEPNGLADVSRAGVLAMNGIRKNPIPPPDVAAPDPKALEAIGRALEAHYADLVQAPLPEKLVELLARLENGDRASEPQGGDDANG